MSQPPKFSNDTGKDNGIPLKEADAAPKTTDVVPETASAVPKKMAGAAPKTTDIVPEMASAALKMTDVALETASAVPKMTPEAALNLKAKCPLICVISSASLKELIRRKESVQIFTMSLYHVNKAHKVTIPTPNPPEPSDYKWLKFLLPSEYHSFVLLFCKSNANQLPPHCPYSHRIPWKEGLELPCRPLYSLACHELEACKKWIKENLDKGFIWTSLPPAGTPILFVKKGNELLWCMVAYRGINEGTIKNRYPFH